MATCAATSESAAVAVTRPASSRRLGWENHFRPRVDARGPGCVFMLTLLSAGPRQARRTTDDARAERLFPRTVRHLGLHSRRTNAAASNAQQTAQSTTSSSEPAQALCRLADDLASRTGAAGACPWTSAPGVSGIGSRELAD